MMLTPLLRSRSLICRSIVIAMVCSVAHAQTQPSPPDQPNLTSKLKQLSNSANLRVADRRVIALAAAKELNGSFMKETDVNTLLDQSSELFADGIVPTVSELEYFGENPTAQAQLKPVAEVSKKLFQQVALLAGGKLTALGDSLKTDADVQRLKPQMDKMRLAKFTGEYMDARSGYALCISTPKSDANRKKLADDVLDYLKQFDDANSGEQANIRLQIGKLQLAKGDYATAKAAFDSVADDPERKITPAPVVAEQNDARYFGIVAEILARKLPDALKDIPQLETWESINYLPKLSPADQSAVKAALAMLKFRLYSAQSDLTNDEDVKKTTNDQAIDVLSKLLKDQPDLKDLIYDQMIGRIPDSADLTSMNSFILQAMQQQGFVQVLKSADEKVDEKNLTRAVAAARILLVRKAESGITDKDLDTSAFFIGYALDRLGQQKEAATAFMDYAEKFSADKTRATDALDHATAIIGELRKKDRDGETPDPDTRKLYDRFLPLAINEPFNRRQFAFQYAALSQAERNFKQAVTYFKLVTENSKQYPDAQYLEMLALSQELADPNLPEDDRRQAVDQAVALTEKIDGFVATAQDEQAKHKFLNYVVNADLIRADLLRREKKDPEKSLAALDGFEAKITGADNADKAHINALQMRISNFMDLGKVDQATQTLISLLAVDEAEGKDLMFGVLKTVGHDMDIARSAGNTTDLRKLAVDQAQLSGFVVSWAAKNKDPKVQAQLGQFELFNADSKREAAELLEDPVAKKTGLNEALKIFQDLLTKNPDDLAAQQGVGLVQFSLGNYQQAIDSLSPLINNKKVGEPTETTTVNGATQITENTQYWEANYKLLKSLFELARQNPHDPQSRKYLSDANSYIGSLFILNGKKTGGKIYHDDFDRLKSDIATLLK